MPLDEKQKLELLKMIEEQNKALLMGRSSKKSIRKKTTLKKIQPDELNSSIEEPLERTYQESRISLTEGIKHAIKKNSEIRSRLKTEVRETFNLDWKLTLAVIISLVGILTIGILIGYIFAIVNITKYS